MDKQFLNDNFLLTTETAKKLYHHYAANMPIFDFHCHLNPKEIADDKQFVDLSEVWLGGDHYKWRLMREYGIEEKFISGSADGFQKFLKYAQIMPYCIGNPLYVWTHLELKRYFGIDTVLNANTAKQVWESANQKLKELSVRKMLKLSNVKTIFTTDDPVDSLQYHRSISDDKSFDIKVFPAMRPDKAINIHLPTFVPYIKQLSEVVGTQIKSLDDLLVALAKRIEFFNEHGCCCSDHALDTVPHVNLDKKKAQSAFEKSLKGSIDSVDADNFRFYLLLFLGEQYHKHGWVQQYHIGALRNNSTIALQQMGADTGFDAINDSTFAPQLASLLNAQAVKSTLPKTILYNLNPRDNEVLATIKNCFSQSEIVSKIQFGSAWWFNDQRDGISKQLEALSQVGLLSKFVGMLTDSRSFMSFPRHEYFRRVLCKKLGEHIESGEYPLSNLDLVGGIVQDICFNNAVLYFSK
ncbi:MAG: glucuronate isomerase [Clostridiales bacterium]|jgi:glucuronate isomerase|nr:glucuronate isomerase [Clostridiales bacterium]